MSRVAGARRYLMCRPTHYTVRYSINPWMDPAVATHTDVGLAQWKWLHDVLVELGHHVDVIPPEPDLPDMVFAANGATVVDGRALVARFRHPHRACESAAYLRWFRRHGWTDVRQARYPNEGEGDMLLVGDILLAGSGFRSDRRASAEIRSYLRRPAVDLVLVDPRFYHLDTALAVLDDRTIAYLPEAFCPSSRRVLAERFPDAVLATEADAAAFGLNAVSDGHHVLLSSSAPRLADQLRERGYQPIGVDVSELKKAGGGAKCCVLELRPAARPEAGGGTP